MAQADYNIANQSGSAFRSELNSTLSAILSLNSGGTAPTTTVAYSLWADTTTGLLKIRDSSNSSFVTIGTMGAPNLGLATLAGITTNNINTSGNITTSGTLSVQGVKFGLGAGSVATNTAAGTNALNANNGGFNNTAIGAGTLQANTNGEGNTAVGVDALNDNTGGTTNTAIGRWSLPINVSGDNNTAVGAQALFSNTAGDDNTAIGLNVLYKTTSNDNTGLGAYALQENITGTSNVAVGRAALFAKVTGNENTAIGTNALNPNISGSNNVGIGYNVSSSTSTISNEVNISNNSVIARFQGAASAWTFVSDVRDKTNIQDLTLGLDFITALKPRKFNWDMRNSEVDKGKPAAGFIAQEVLETVKTFNAPYTNLIDTNDPNQYTFAQANMIPILVKAVQELSAMVKQLQSDPA